MTFTLHNSCGRIARVTRTVGDVRVAGAKTAQNSVKFGGGGYYSLIPTDNCDAFERGACGLSGRRAVRFLCLFRRKANTAADTFTFNLGMLRLRAGTRTRAVVAAIPSFTYPT